MRSDYMRRNSTVNYERLTDDLFTITNHYRKYFYILVEASIPQFAEPSFHSLPIFSSCYFGKVEYRIEETASTIDNTYYVDVVLRLRTPTLNSRLTGVATNERHQKSYSTVLSDINKSLFPQLR